jgi:hypothetical protein
MVETIKMLTITPTEVRKRMKPANADTDKLVDTYFKQGKSIIGAVGIMVTGTGSIKL